MLNFVVDPKVLAPFLPVGTELDFFEGKTFSASLASFFSTRVFLACRFLCIAISRK